MCHHRSGRASTYAKVLQCRILVTVSLKRFWMEMVVNLRSIFKGFRHPRSLRMPGFSRRAGDRRFSPCTKVYHAGYKFWIHFIFGTTLNVSTKETKRFLLSAYKVLCKCRICSYKCCRFSKFPGGACSRTLLDDPPLTSILSPPTMPHLGEP